MSYEKTRQEIKEILPDDVEFSIRKMNFPGDEAYVLRVRRGEDEFRGLSGIFTKKYRQKWLDVIQACKKLKHSTYKGKHLLV